MFCMHTYPYYGTVSPTGDVAIKKPKVRTMDFHGLSLRPLVVKGLKHKRRKAAQTLIDLLATTIITMSAFCNKDLTRQQQNCNISYPIIHTEERRIYITQWHADGCIQHKDIKASVNPEIDDLEIQVDLTRQQSANIIPFRNVPSQ